MLAVCTMLSGNARDPAGRTRRHTGHAPAACPSSLQAAHSVMTACQGRLTCYKDAGERVDIMTGSGGKVLSAFVEEVSPMRTHLRDDHWRPYVIPNKVITCTCLLHACLTGICAG